MSECVGLNLSVQILSVRDASEHGADKVCQGNQERKHLQAFGIFAQ